jgi:hypothetical protein
MLLMTEIAGVTMLAAARLALDELVAWLLTAERMTR